MANSEEAVIKKRTDKVKNWLRNKNHIILLVILILAIFLRWHYFVQTNTQPLWYDEGDYLSTAKSWAYNIPYDLNEHRPPLFQFLAALAFMLNLGENFIRLFLVLLPSVILVLCVYYLGKEMFDEKIALIASFFMAVSWTLLFWTTRVQPDFFSLSFSVLSFLFMWKYWKNEKTKFAVYAGIFAALGFHFKVSGLLVPIIFMVFIFIKDRFLGFKNKNYYYFAISFLLVLVPYFIWSKLTFGTSTAFRSGYSNAIVNVSPFAWKALAYFKILTDNITFILFIIGLVLALKFVLYLDVLVKDRKKCIEADLFAVLSLIIIWAFYIFYIRGIEDRWVFLGLPFIFFLVGRASMFIYNFVKKYNKGITAAIVIALILFGGYLQYKQADPLIKSKSTTYLPVKQAALWMKDNSISGDKILTISTTQTFYYAERQILLYSEINESDFLPFIDKEKPKFLEVSVFEAHPSWINDWINSNGDRLKIVQAYFADIQKKQPVLIIYEINY